WRRLHGQERAGTPRRLIYALPQRTPLDPLAGTVRTWLENLELTDEVALHVVLAERGADLGDWRENMHLPAIVVGTADALVAKALNRGYGVGRALFPIDFALVTNGAQWVVDEAGLCPVATATLRQLAGRCRTKGTAEPFRLPCLSALALARPTVPDGGREGGPDGAPEGKPEAAADEGGQGAPGGEPQSHADGGRDGGLAGEPESSAG